MLIGVGKARGRNRSAVRRSYGEIGDAVQGRVFKNESAIARISELHSWVSAAFGVVATMCAE